MMPIYSFSVIIPAFNEEKEIGPCLRAVLAQDYPAEGYEVIVVDNASTDRTAYIVRTGFPSVILVQETRQGIAYARMAGIQAAKNEIIASTDADSLVPALWLARMAACYVDPEVVAVGGTFYYSGEKKWLHKANDGINLTYQNGKHFPGANISFRKAAYEACGGYSPKINVGDDYDISRKLARIGRLITLKDNAVITSPRRFSSPRWLGDWVKYLINLSSIALFKRALFIQHRNVREN
jgi:glycosyltransferase involved in cell wall biosynthesis